MTSKIIVCFVIICRLNVIWCMPWAQYGFNQSSNSAGNGNWQNRDANSYGIDSMPANSRSLYPTLQPNYQPNMGGPWNSNNNNIYPQVPHDNDGQRSVNPAVYPLQPNLDHSNPTDDHQATIPPFKDNGPYNNPGARYNTRPQITPTRPATITVTRPRVVPYNRTLPTNQPASNYNNYANNHDDRYNGGGNPNSQFNNTRNYNPNYPNQGGLNANRNGTEGMYNYRPQPFDNRPGQPYNQNSNVQRPIDPYSGYNNIGQSTFSSPLNNNRSGQPYNQNSNVQRPIDPYSGYNNIGQSTFSSPSNNNRSGQPYNQNSNVQRPIDPYSGNNNIGQSTYNSPSNNNAGQLPYNGQSNVGQSSYNSRSNYNPFNNNNNNNAISNRNSFEPSTPSNNNLKYNGPPAQPDYDPNGIALAPFPENDRLFNPQNLLGRQQPSKYNNPSVSYNKDTLHVPLAPFPTR